MRALLRTAALLSVLLSFFLHAAAPGTLIANTAHLNYRLGDFEHNLSTNEVKSRVAFTPATLQFLRVQSEGSAETLQRTYYRDGGAVRPMPPATLPDGTTIPTPSVVDMNDTERYALRDLVIVRVQDRDRDLNASAVDRIDVNVSNPRTGESESLILLETGENTGVFVGYLFVDPDASAGPDGALRCAPQDRIRALYLDRPGPTLLEDWARIEGKRSGLFVTKAQSRDTASIGDFVRYTLTVTNRTGIDQRDVLVEDRLPAGLKYRKGSMRLDDSPVTPEYDPATGILRVWIANLPNGRTATIRYVVLVTAAARGEAINAVWASALAAKVSNTAKTTLKIVDVLGRSRGYILGRVYRIDEADDQNGSALPQGVAGVRLYMEDGRSVVTDSEGKYHFLDVKNQSHVVQIDPATIRGYEAVPCREEVQTAHNPLSRFVDMFHGELRRADFCLRKRFADTSLRLHLELKTLDPHTLRLEASSNRPAPRSELYLSLPDGIHPKADPKIRREEGIWIVPLRGERAALTLVVTPNAQPEGSIRGVLYYDDNASTDLHTEVAEVVYRTDGSGKLAATIPTPVGEAQSAPATDEDDLNWTQPTHPETMPAFTPERVDALGDKPAIVWPPKGWIPDFPATKIAVVHPKGLRLRLRLNGRAIDTVHFEDIFPSSDRKKVVEYYKGIDLREGANTITAILTDASGKVVARLHRSVFVESRAPARIEYLPKYSYPVADGKHPTILAFRFVGPSGHPLRGGVVGRFEVDPPYEPLEKDNGQGLYRIDSEGIAYIRLKEGMHGGLAHLRFPLYGDKEQRFAIRIHPQMGDWFVVGLAEGTVGYRRLHGSKRLLRERGLTEGWTHQGRLSLFAKGPLGGDWLMTFAYDSGRGHDDRAFFDTLDPDKYYSLYKDASNPTNEAPSRRKLYLRLENGGFGFLFGDFHAALEGSELAGYDATYTGALASYEGSRLHLRLFGAQTDTLRFREILRGNGSRGYYRLGHTPIVVGSETVTLVTRDRHHPERIVRTETMTRYSDYDIDYDRGTLYFHDPVYGYDDDFNPVYIEVRYETETQGHHYDWGGRIAYDLLDGNLTIGATYIDRDQGDGHHRLGGVDLHYRIDAHNRLHAEAAYSRNRVDADTITGEARLLEWSYDDENRSARAWYRYESSNFGLDNEEDILGGTRQIGLQGRWRFASSWEVESQAYQNRTYEADGNTSDETVGELSLRYDDDNQSAAIGYRYALQSDRSPTHQLTLSYGRYFFDRRLKLTVGHDQSLGSNENDEYPTRTYLGASWRYDDNLSLEASIERQLASDGVQWLGRADLRYVPWENGEIRLGHSIESDAEGTRLYDTFGLRQTLLLAERWRFTGGYEHGQGNGGDRYDAINGDLSYRNERYTWRTALGYRVGGGERQLDFNAAFVLEHSSSTAMGASLQMHFLDAEEFQRTIRASLAYAYRPLQGDWILLDRFDYKNDLDSESDETSLVNHFHLNYSPFDSPWEIGLQYALKYTLDTIDGERFESWSDLLGATVDYSFDDRWGVGAQASVVHSYTGGDFDFAGGVYLSYSPIRDLQLSLGYNFAGVEDEDFNALEYRYKGPYLRVRMKFDTQDLKQLIDGVLR